MAVSEEDTQEADPKLTNFLLQKPWYIGTKQNTDANADAGTVRNTSLSSSVSSRVSDSLDHTREHYDRRWQLVEFLRSSAPPTPQISNQLFRPPPPLLQDAMERTSQREREKAGDDSPPPARLQNISRLVSRLRDRVRKRLSRDHY